MLSAHMLKQAVIGHASDSCDHRTADHQQFHMLTQAIIEHAFDSCVCSTGPPCYVCVVICGAIVNVLAMAPRLHQVAS